MRKFYCTVVLLILFGALVRKSGIRHDVWQILSFVFALLELNFELGNRLLLPWRGLGPLGGLHSGR